MDAQPKIGGFGCFKGVLQIPSFFLCNFTRQSFILILKWPLRPGTIRAAPSLSSSSTSSPRHAGIAGLSNIGQAPCTRPSGPSEDKLFGLNQQADRTATMNPVLICLLVVVTFFLLCDAARTGLAQGRAISPTP